MSFRGAGRNRLAIGRYMCVKYVKQLSVLLRYHYPDFEMRSPELKARKGAGRRAVPGHSGTQQRCPLGVKEDENQAWLAMLEKATNSVRYISRHIKKEHFIREVWGWANRREGVGRNALACMLYYIHFEYFRQFHLLAC